MFTPPDASCLTTYILIYVTITLLQMYYVELSSCCRYKHVEMSDTSLTSPSPIYTGVALTVAYLTGV